MTHFISATCNGHTCRCGKPATHKVGEEIPPDEPCMTCGQADNPLCSDFYHIASGPSRHNLTSYVCCFHFTLLLGAMTRCPLAPSPPLSSPCCDADLVAIGTEASGRRMFICCRCCSTAFELPVVGP